MSTTYSEFAFVDLVIKHAKRMRRIILLPVPCPTVHFSVLFQKRYDFQEKLLNIKRVLIYCTSFIPNFSHS